MSYAIYEDTAALRTWRQNELRLRRRMADAIVETVETTARELNRAWTFEEVEAPTMMPVDEMSAAYTSDDIFLLRDAPGGTRDWAMRAETTFGSYAAAVRILRTTSVKPPLCVWQMGTSYRRETNDGASVSRLRLNAFVQLELQLILREDTVQDVAEPIRDALVPLVQRLTGLETRRVASDRLPSYATETVDIECLLPNGDWREVASTSRRTDFPTPPEFKPLKVVEIAFGMDRMVALANGTI